MKKNIFISYSDKDRNKMRSLEKIIRATKYFEPVIVADNRQALLQITEKVTKGIKESFYFIPILTEHSIATQWVNQEVGYATAKERKIVPIVEKKIITSLAGFIHNQLDLSYTFESSEKSKRAEALKFNKSAKILINDLLLENLFPGKWISYFEYKNGTNGTDSDIEIKETNKYFVEGVHVFNLENIGIDLKKNKVSFRKIGLPGDNRKLFNDLNIIKFGKKYEGFEENDIKVSYTRDLTKTDA